MKKKIADDWAETIIYGSIFFLILLMAAALIIFQTFLYDNFLIARF